MKKNKKVKLKLKKKFKIILDVILILFFIMIIKKIFIKKEYVSNIEFKDNKLIVNVNDDVSCILSNNTPTLNDKWIKSLNNKCIIDYDNFSKLYIKYKSEIIDMSLNTINYIDIESKNKIYLTNNSKYKYIKTYIGEINKLNIKNIDKDIAYIDEDGYIISNNLGEGSILLEYNDNVKEIKVIVSDLITTPSQSFDYNKPLLSCNQFSKKDNDILDLILKDRINDAGYKTRAGVVEAARFLTLEFPYKISYFYENGRLSSNGIDAEGRYYHEGLYLHESRFSNITKSTNNPVIWGCDIKSVTRDYIGSNGLDCSGFVSWALLNAGFDIGDIGAGFSDGEDNDLTDYGELLKLNDKIDYSLIKVGDLLHSEHSGGHIAMIVGIDKDYFHVAHVLWNYAPTSLTKRSENAHYVQITKYTKNEMINVFNEVILMDKYYKLDGNLTNMW